MLITGAPMRRRKSSLRICMYRANTTRSTSPASSSSDRCSASPFRSGVTGTWWYGTPNGRTCFSRSGWFDTTATTSASSSPRCQRQRRSSTQWSWRDANSATRWRAPASAIRQFIANSPATTASFASTASLRRGSSSRWNSMRRKNRPPSGSVEYWSDEMMFAPLSARSRDSAAMIPDRSGHETISRATSAPSLMTVELRASREPRRQRRSGRGDTRPRAGG